MWPFTKKKGEELAPPRMPEEIDPDYPKREYQLEDTGEDTYYIRYRVADSTTWHYLTWYDTKPYYPNWYDQHSVARAGSTINPYYKSTFRAPESIARQWAFNDAMHHYKLWKAAHKKGAIIELGKLP